MGNRRRHTKIVTNYGKVIPTSLRHAMELCKDYAREKQNLSVERIADLMGIGSQYTLYGYIAKGDMPVKKIPSYEHICGIDFVTRYLAQTQDKLIVSLSTGRKATTKDLNNLCKLMHDTSGLLIEFYKKNKGAEETLQAITCLLENLTYQHHNVKKYHQPELELM